MFKIAATTAGLFACALAESQVTVPTIPTVPVVPDVTNVDPNEVNAAVEQLNDLIVDSATVTNPADSTLNVDDLTNSIDSMTNDVLGGLDNLFDGLVDKDGCELMDDYVWAADLGASGTCLNYSATVPATCETGCTSILNTCQTQEVCDKYAPSSSALVIIIIVLLLVAIAVGVVAYCLCCKSKDDDDYGKSA